MQLELKTDSGVHNYIHPDSTGPDLASGLCEKIILDITSAWSTPISFSDEQTKETYKSVQHNVTEIQL